MFSLSHAKIHRALPLCALLLEIVGICCQRRWQGQAYVLNEAAFIFMHEN